MSDLKDLNKKKITELVDLCKELGIEFDEVYSRTNTSYKPMTHMIMDDEARLVPVWFSDYKSASSVERIEAFIKLGRPDPVAYANSEGPVSWEVAKTHVEKILAEHE